MKSFADSLILVDENQYLVYQVEIKWQQKICYFQVSDHANVLAC